MSRRALLLFALVGAVALLGSCMTLAALFPVVDPPVSDEASMIVVEVGEGIPGDSDALMNTNFTGWAPWVVDEAGELVTFKPFDTESRLDSFYYAPNLMPGTYTMKGFLHVYTDYGRLGDGSGASYGPFEDHYYHVKQFFPLDDELLLSLDPAIVDTFGSHYIQYEWKDGASGTTDDRWKVAEDSFSVVSEPENRRPLRVAKNWKTSNWKLWNERNPEEAADE
ncbi:MAG: hypothetical protein ACQEQU_08205 [Spirochaetota bacterium]